MNLCESVAKFCFCVIFCLTETQAALRADPYLFFNQQANPKQRKEENQQRNHRNQAGLRHFEDMARRLRGLAARATVNALRGRRRVIGRRRGRGRRIVRNLLLGKRVIGLLLRRRRGPGWCFGTRRGGLRARAWGRRAVEQIGAAKTAEPRCFIVELLTVAARNHQTPLIPARRQTRLPINDAPGWTPTNGLPLRRRSLYAPELRERTL